MKYILLIGLVFSQYVQTLGQGEVKVLDYQKKYDDFLQLSLDITENGKLYPYQDIYEKINAGISTPVSLKSIDNKHTIPLTPKSSYTDLCQGVLMLGLVYKVDGGYRTVFSSAFIISPDGLCVTSHNAIAATYDNCIASLVMDYNNKVYPITDILYADKASNVVVFRIKAPKGLRALTLGGDIAIGSEVSLIGHPDGLFYNFSSGTVNQKVYYNQNMLMISAPFCKGAYGAPVFNVKGEVVGICSNNKPIYYEGNPNSPFQMMVNICTPIDALKTIIK